MKGRVAISSNASFHCRKRQINRQEGKTSQAVTVRLRVRGNRPCQTGGMDDEPTIPPIVERYADSMSEADKQEIAAELQRLFVVLYQSFRAGERFDSKASGMIESESPNQLEI